jgi:predicted DCC family thiol-disulfide oxidoreductase YuxK
MTTAIYDGNCVLCQRTRRTVRALDWFKRVEFLDVHRWSVIEARYPQLDFETAMGQIHIVTPDGGMIGGFAAMRRLLRDLPLGYPLWLALHLPGMNWLGPKLYGLVARNRYRINRWFGVELCDNGTCKVHN